MKTIIALAVLFNISAVSAQGNAPDFYSANFEVTKVSPMCPDTIPSGAMCYGLGSIVEVKATIGCADTLLSKTFEVLDNNVIYAQSLVKRHPKADLIRCIRAQVITDTVIVQYPGPVTLINVIAE